MQKFKEKLEAFYNKSYKSESRQGGWFDVASGNFLPLGPARAHWHEVFNFARTDGHKNRTKKGIKIEERNQRQFLLNLKLLGIVFISNDFDDWKFISNYFNNETSPVIKKAYKRDEWAKS